MLNYLYIPFFIRIFAVQNITGNMKFKVGDKVNFLNEKGGGTVTAIVDNKLVKIKTNDGFEMPVLASELILDYRALAKEEIYESIAPVRTPEPEAVQETVESEPETISEINPWGTVKEDKGVYMAFEPHEQQWILTGDMDVVLLNNTSYDMLYSLFFERDGIMEGVDYGSLPADSKIVLETISRDDIEDWTKGFLQFMLHKDFPERLYLPVHTEIKIKPGRFFKEGNYISNTLLDGKAILIAIMPQAAIEIVSDQEHVKKFGQKGKTQIAQPVKEKPLIEKHKTSIGEAVVDLHIGELIDNITGLTSHDMFNIQIVYFKKTLNSAITNDYTKVTFIHGVGNGVLKSAIIKELEAYEGLENKMASISKFGVGAVDVLIKNKD